MNNFLTNLLNVARRYPFSVACGVVAILLTATAIWFLPRLNRQLEVELRDQEKDEDSMSAKKKSGSLLRQELSDVRSITRRIDENLVVESNLAENLWYFYKIEEQTRAQLPELHQVNAPAADKSTLYRRVGYTLRVVGTYEQVAAFLLAIETGPRLLRITNFNLTRTDVNGRTVSLDLSVEMLGKK